MYIYIYIYIYNFLGQLLDVLRVLPILLRLVRQLLRVIVCACNS